MKNFNLESFGGGAGLRHGHFNDILEKNPPIKWFEIISEEFMTYGGRVMHLFDQIAERYPIIGHGVTMSIGSTDPIDMSYLKKLKKFMQRVKSPWASDHLCFTMVDHTNLNELVPIPFTDEAVNNCVERLKIIQNELEIPFLIENVTRYMTISDREMSEIEFITRILEESNCGLLLDVTNVYLNSIYHKYNALEFIKSLPLERVGQMHLSGFQILDDGSFIDSHDAEVPDQVWQLFQDTIKLTGPSSVLIEWDKHLPPIETIVEQTILADNKMNEALKELEAA
ncbi:MAG: DUF692 domain-containing protein [Bdellovibrionales bacterium]|nr:DUF692 domain-containing protein [Bdellovibrionales bacterium]